MFKPGRPWGKLAVLVTCAVLLDVVVAIRFGVDLFADYPACVLVLVVVNVSAVVLPIWYGGGATLDRIERRILRRARAYNMPPSPPEPTGPFLAPVVLAFEFIVLGLVATVAVRNGVADSLQIIRWGYLGLPVGVGAGLSALILHRFPRHNRKFKYALVAFWMFSVNLASVGKEAMELEEYSPVDAFVVVGMVVLACDAVALAVFSLRASSSLRPNERIRPKSEASRLAVRRYRQVMRLSPRPGCAAIFMFTVVRLVPFLLTWLLVHRYFASHKLAQSPVIYLRSFANLDGVKIFSRYVLPTVVRHAPITGLAHETQSSADLQRNVHSVQRAHLETVGDAHWKEWVEAQLHHCLAVVIDISGETKGVAWELDKALEIVPASRIFVIHGQAPPKEIPQTVARCRFEGGVLSDVDVLGNSQLPAKAPLSQQLEEWTRRALQSELGVPA